MINVKQFENIHYAYISPDPQGHTPTYIWFVVVGDYLVIRAHDTTSTWWKAAIENKTGKMKFDEKWFEVNFQRANENEELMNEANDLYLKKYTADEGIYTRQAVIPPATDTTLKVQVIKEVN